MRLRIFLLLFLVFVGCSQDHFEPEYNIQVEFQPIVEKFLIESRERGFDYLIDNLIIRYDDEINQVFCANCNSKDANDKIQKIISVNPSICWLNEFQKEALIFHELGHCFLLRDHDSSLLPNGDPKSMMIEDNISIYSPCIYAFGDADECNFLFKRTYYLDELFDEETPIPDWAK